MRYAGRHRFLTYLSLLLSAASAALALFPFVFLFRIIQEVIAVAPNLRPALSIFSYGAPRWSMGTYLVSLYFSLSSSSSL